MHDDRNDRELTRRRVLGLGAGAVLAAGSGALASLLTACSGAEEDAAPAPPQKSPTKPPGGGAAPPAAEGASPSAGPPPPSGTAAGDAKLVTAYPENEALVSSLQYAHESPKADQHCSNCFFYTAAGEDRGRCQLFARGLVEAGGWCSSWQAKPA